MKKLLLPLLILSLLTGCGKTEVRETETTAPDVQTNAETELAGTAAETDTDTAVLVSLGDSIARGYGLADPENQAYISVAAESLGAVSYNFGVDGQDSTELLSYITANAAIPEAVADADYVTISIGANNFLGDAFTFLGVYNDYKTNPSTTYTTESVTAAFQQFNADVTEGIDTLRADIPQIIDAIRAENSECDILFLTCYNPYGAVSVTLDWGNGVPVAFDTLSDTCVTRMNDVIRELADEQGYTIADVYTAFDGKADRLVNAAPVESGDTFDANAIDPHPNKNGHNLIAEVLLEIIKN